MKSGYDKYKNKIGNFLLLTQKINSTVGNKYITDKQKEYENYCKGLKTYMNNDERIDVSRKNS
ncbi:MAG: HNH endonuclease family protein [Methanobrevibacter sp.]|nr:HNH endonuclease family protein [Candidatus Methanovirga basalitermitum]